jgi:hypothetical protein
MGKGVRKHNIVTKHEQIVMHRKTTMHGRTIKYKGAMTHENNERWRNKEVQGSNKARRNRET